MGYRIFKIGRKKGPLVPEKFRLISEGLDLSVDDHVGDLVDVVEPLVCDGLGLGLPGLELLLLLSIGKNDLDGTVERLGDRLSDL